MIFTAAIAFGFIFAVWGYKRGLYAMWATLFNVVIGIYLGIMLTPTIAGTFGEYWPLQTQKNFWYAYAGCVAGVALAAFFILETIATAFFTGIFTVSLPRLLNRIGSVILGFITGYVVWVFICFIVLIMPVSQNLLLKSFTSQESVQMSMPAISRLLNLTNILSSQPNREQVSKVVHWTLGIDKNYGPDVPDANTVDTSDANTSGANITDDVNAINTSDANTGDNKN